MQPKMTYKAMKKKEYSTKEKVLKLLKKKPMCVSDLTKQIDVTQPRISCVLKELYDDKIVKKQKTKNYVFYGLIKIGGKKK